jgi:hypothetical protein
VSSHSEESFLPCIISVGFCLRVYQSGATVPVPVTGFCLHVCVSEFLCF